MLHENVERVFLAHNQRECINLLVPESRWWLEDMREVTRTVTNDGNVKLGNLYYYTILS
jgi:hypothetical protein